MEKRTSGSSGFGLGSFYFKWCSSKFSSAGNAQHASWKHANQRFSFGRSWGWTQEASLQPGSSPVILMPVAPTALGETQPQIQLDTISSDVHLLQARIVLKGEAPWQLGCLDFWGPFVLGVIFTWDLKPAWGAKQPNTWRAELSKGGSSVSTDLFHAPAPGCCSTRHIFLSRFPSLLFLCFP